MARRIVRPARPPYLLIVFIILTVGCAIGLGIFASLYVKARQQAAGEERLKKAAGKFDPVQSVLDTEKADNLMDLVERYQKLAEVYKHNVGKVSLLLTGDDHAGLSGEQLDQSINMDVAEIDNVISQAGAALRKSLAMTEAEVKAPEILNMKAAARALMTRIDELGALRTAKEEQLEARLTEIREIQKTMAAKEQASRDMVDKAYADSKAEREKFWEHRQRLEKQNEDLKKEHGELLARHAAEKKAWQQQMDTLGNEFEKLRAQTRDLSDMIAKFRTLALEVDVDGQVEDVISEKDVAYISLGKGDGVLLGMTFAVYSPEEIGKENAEPKAAVRVIKIMENVSEASIFNQRPHNPVAKGDVIANPVYDKSRRFHFAIIGKCDIDGDGVDDTAGLKARIVSFGGVVDEKLAVQTDYLIVGEELPVPAPLGRFDVSLKEREEYEKQHKAIIEYNRALAMARDFAIPTLTVNRFLGLTGAGE